MNDDVDQKRRHFLTVATAVTGGVGVAFALVPFLASLKPSARALALGAPVEVPVGLLEPGEMIRVMWRGRVVFVLRRDTDMLSRLRDVTDLLRDPDSENEEQQPPFAVNEHRSIILPRAIRHQASERELRDEPMNTLNAETATSFSPFQAANTSSVQGDTVQPLPWGRSAANDPRRNSPTSHDYYATDHRMAKLVVCLAYILLGAVSIELGNPYIALVAGTGIWFFGINAVGYLIESLRGHCHTHQWV